MPASDETRDASTADELLRRIESVTDIALAHLGVEDLLVELLERVQGLLDVDTAAVLLLDPSGEYLVATAAKGIEAEVRQGVRIPLGRGFAGRIAAAKQPVLHHRPGSPAAQLVRVSCFPVHRAGPTPLPEPGGRESGIFAVTS